VTDVAEIVSLRFRAMSSAAVGPPDWLAPHPARPDAAPRGAPPDGGVVTPGPAPLEGAADFLTLPPQVDAPLVLVGSPRPATAATTSRAWTSPRRTPAPTARPSGPSWPPAPARSFPRHSRPG